MQTILILCLLFGLSGRTYAQGNDNIRANLNVHYYTDDGEGVITSVHNNIAVLRDQLGGFPANVIANGQVDQFQFNSGGVIPRPGNINTTPPGPGNEPDEDTSETPSLPNETTTATAGDDLNETTPTEETTGVGASVVPSTPSGETTTTLETSTDGNITTPSGTTTTDATPTDETSETGGSVVSTTPSGETTTTLETSTDGNITTPSGTTTTDATPTNETSETGGSEVSTTPSGETTTTLKASVGANMTSPNRTTLTGAGTENVTIPDNVTSNEGGVTTPSSETPVTTEAAPNETDGSSGGNGTTPTGTTTTTPSKNDTSVGGNSGKQGTTPIAKTSTTVETPSSTTTSSNKPTTTGKPSNETGFNIFQSILRELGYNTN